EHPSLRIPGKMLRRPVRIQRRLVVVLLVEEELPGLRRGAVDQVHPTARLSTRGPGQLAEKLARLALVSRLDHVRHGDADHVDALLTLVLRFRPSASDS